MGLIITNQILGSFILILLFILWDLIIKNPKVKKENLQEELKNWPGTIRDFMEFKKYQYNQHLNLIFSFLPFTTFAIGIIIGVTDKFISLIGIVLYLQFDVNCIGCFLSITIN